MSLWVNQDGDDSYSFGNKLDALSQIEVPQDARLKLLKKLKVKVELRGSFKDSYLLLHKITSAIASVDEVDNEE
jgi:urate oxidase